jgi:hypothetical protein
MGDPGVGFDLFDAIRSLERHARDERTLAGMSSTERLVVDLMHERPIRMRSFLRDVRWFMRQAEKRGVKLGSEAEPEG